MVRMRRRIDDDDDDNNNNTKMSGSMDEGNQCPSQPPPSYGPPVVPSHQ